MPTSPIILNSRNLTVHKAYMQPDFYSRTVLADDPWEYVEMYIKREQNSTFKAALNFWGQAKDFYNATTGLPKTSSPLTAYYCFLNAVKALLLIKGKVPAKRHGVSGEFNENYTALTNEKVYFKTGGVLAQFCSYYGEALQNEEEYSLRSIFYNLPFFHRAYGLTFKNDPELFLPIWEPKFVLKDNSLEAWFMAELRGKENIHGQILKKLPNSFEVDEGYTDRTIIRRHARFIWKKPKAEREASIDRLTNYHKTLRKDIHYIYGSDRYWYVKLKGKGAISRNPMTLTFAAMHKLSELARYAPDKLNSHFTSQHNWLLTEFINRAPQNFIDCIASEITGQEFLPPGIRTKNISPSGK